MYRGSLPGQYSFFSPSFRTQSDFALQVSHSAKPAHSHCPLPVARCPLPLHIAFANCLCPLPSSLPSPPLCHYCLSLPARGSSQSLLCLPALPGGYTLYRALSSSVAPVNYLALPSASDQAVVRTTHQCSCCYSSSSLCRPFQSTSLYHMLPHSLHVLLGVVM